MLTFILAELIAIANPLPPPPPQAQATLPVEAPKTRRVCHDLPGAFTRTPRRVCTIVEVTQPTVALAPTTPPPPVLTTIGVGMAVVDSQGGAVGTITAVAADSVTVTTDKHQAQLPKTSLTVSEGKALFGLTQAELNASVEQSLATIAMTALKVGAAVTGTAGASVGTIDAVEADKVTIRLASGLRISVPRSGITASADGSGVIGITAAELEAQVKAAQPAH